VDGNHQWNGVDESGIPEFLLGADYIMPFNVDKSADKLEVTLSLAQPATVYVLFDDRGPAPSWLRDQFIDTGCDIGLDEYHRVGRASRRLARGPGVGVDRTFSIWKRDCPVAGTVVLGPRGGTRARGRAMYGIAVAPLTREDLGQTGDWREEAP
jgi:hypothetical protein